MQTVSQKSAQLLQDEELTRLRTLFAHHQPCPPKGIRKFFHNLAERSAQPSKSIIMERIRQAS